ncbi:MAG: ferrous iron transport protein A [Saprospiraceae bacterium]|nr:ferrous iron transport protein A [Candidatus Vicinibacter affinis]MBK7695657.1 ferrous iron transport protein A [Candidatus Vicinibacter affinis]MBK7697053.1 ferrous iron transport protein A [Candidatus Vicinibacter affinis]MBK9963172.1 ferrous iron transport protein A [Candidatus Vicinibacter affinis]MBP6174612.1 ferrous iron transport protein A [Saprospiraceae bacterium]
MQRVIQSILHEALALRLLTLGIYPGKKIELIRQAPFKGACYVQVDDSVYVLRKEEWDAIVFQKTEDTDGLS